MSFFTTTATKTPPHEDINLWKDYVYKMQSDRFEAFKAQDIEKGGLDVIFEIGGKILHVNKSILTSISEPMDSMLSNRWTKTDGPVKIENSSYDNFYQFITFIYTGRCSLTPQNIFQLVDMAEFYDIPLLKNFGDKFLSTMKFNVDAVEEMADIAHKYSLPAFLLSIKTFIFHNIGQIINLPNFNLMKKAFIEFSSTVNRSGIEESEFFAAVYKWAEQKALKQKLAAGDGESFNVEEGIHAELREIVPRIEFDKMSFEYLFNFVIEKGFYLSPAILYKFFLNMDKNYSSGLFVEKIYLLSERQSLRKQQKSPNAYFNIVSSIRADLVEIIPKIQFCELNKTFLKNFVVANGILTEEEGAHIFDTRVEIKNETRTISGSFKDDFGFLKAMQRTDYGCNRIKQSHTKIQKFFGIKFPGSKPPCALKKMKGVEWYLCLDRDALTLKHHSVIGSKDYLLAEMKSSEEFFIKPDHFNYLTATYRNV